MWLKNWPQYVHICHYVNVYISPKTLIFENFRGGVRPVRLSLNPRLPYILWSHILKALGTCSCLLFSSILALACRRNTHVPHSALKQSWNALYKGWPMAVNEPSSCICHEKTYSPRRSNVGCSTPDRDIANCVWLRRFLCPCFTSSDSNSWISLYLLGLSRVLGDAIASLTSCFNGPGHWT